MRTIYFLRAVPVGKLTVIVSALVVSGGSVQTHACNLNQFRVEVYDGTVHTKQNLIDAWCGSDITRAPGNYFGIKHEWGHLGPTKPAKADLPGPVPPIRTDNFLVRWTGEVSFEGGEYEFIVGSDDGIVSWLDAEPIVLDWRDRSYTERHCSRQVTPGEHFLEVRYYEHGGEAKIVFQWKPDGAQVVSCPLQ